MKLLDYTTYIVDISSDKGTFIREIYVKANSIEEALSIGKQCAENMGGEVSKIQKSYYECVEASTKTVTIDL